MRRLDDLPFLDFMNLYGLPRSRSLSPDAAYAVCELVSTSPQKGWLLLGSCDGVKVWLNGEELYSSRQPPHGVETYDDAVPLPLRSGENLLTLKTYRFRHVAWGLTARFEPSAESAAAASLRMRGVINSLLFSSTIVEPAQNLAWGPPGVPENFRLPVVIDRLEGGKLAEVELGGSVRGWSPPPATSPGLYLAHVQLDGETYSQLLCIGNPDSIAERLIQNAASYDRAEARITANIAVLKHRILSVLRSPDRLNRDVWSPKIIYPLSELDTILRTLGAGREAFRDVPGLHLRGFRSRIDDQLECYRLFIPPAYHSTGPELPLVVILPTVVSASRPFIDSAFLTDQSEAERLCALAERYGFGLLWCGYRAQPTGQGGDFTHLDETISAVEGDYHIDNRRIYLLGACSGGAIATMAAVRWPDRFAAIGLLNPVFGLGRHLPVDANAFVGFPAFQSWAAGADVVSSFLQLSGPPMYIDHDGGEPGHGDLSVSVAFAARARAHHYPLRFDQTSQTRSLHFGAWEQLFQWFSAQGRTLGSRRKNNLYFATAEHIGSISNVLAERFVLVAGTGGTDADRAATEKMARAFQTAWRASQYGDCRSVTDRMFQPRDEQNSNLVLLGNEMTNSVWQKLSSQLKVSLGAEAIRVPHHQWSGSHLSFAIDLPDPNRPDRQIVLIGAANLADAHFPNLDLSLGGWFDYLVSGSNKIGGALLDAGLWPPSAPPQLVTPSDD